MMKRLFINSCMSILSTALILVLSTGCGSLETLTKSLQKPSPKVLGVRLSDLSIDAVTLLFDVELDNPYSVPLPLANMDYNLSSDNRAFFSGKAEIQDVIPVGQTKTFEAPVTVQFAQILEFLQDVQLGSIIPYEAKLGMSVDAPGGQSLRLPLEHTGQFPIPAIPTIRFQDIQWEELSLNAARGVLRINVVNNNQFPMELSHFNYNLSLAETEIASTGIDKQIKFAENGGVGMIEIPLNLSPQNLGVAMVRALTGAKANCDCEGVMDVQTPFGPMPLPFQSVGDVLFKR